MPEGRSEQVNEAMLHDLHRIWKVMEQWDNNRLTDPGESLTGDQAMEEIREILDPDPHRKECQHG